MRRATLIAMAVLTSAPVMARDADSIVFGSHIDALIEYADELDDAAAATDMPDPVSSEPGTQGASERRKVIAGRPAVSRDAAAAAASDDDGTSTEFVLRQGYDSNYDESTEPVGSSFTELGATSTWEQQTDGDGLYVGVGATALRLYDLDWKDRGDGYVDIGLRRDLGNGLKFQAGVGLSVDATSDPIDGAAQLTAGVEGEGDMAVWGLRANLAAERALHAREPDEDVPARTYDFLRPEVEASLLLMPEARLSPYVSATVSRTTFPLGLPQGLTDDADVEIPSPDRNATTFSVHGGLRLRPVDDLTLRVGVRSNLRQFDEAGIADLATVGPEISAEWKITPSLSLETVVSRTIGEPEELGALAEDVTSASGTVTLTPIDPVTLTATGTFERTDVYGVESAGDETSIDLAAAYKINPRASLELRYYHYWYRDRVADGDYERRRISGGGSLTF